MNVLILTPDAVGSTLLQRLITIYMQFHSYDRPVINLHELTNGIVKYHSSKFDQEVLGKKEGKWGYYQSLEQVVELLDSVNHYKTSRLAHYHIKNRQDSMSDQIAFYRYLNENFYIISCRRHNIFEHALSMCLSKITKKLNVYGGQEKIDSFFDLYRNGIELDPNSLLQTLNAYRDYIIWCNNHFDIANYFLYEEHLPTIENYILNLPIFAQQTQQLTWKNKFDMEFDTWNKCHFMSSDMGTIALDQPEQFAQLTCQAKTMQSDPNEDNFIASYNRIKDPAWPKVNTMQQYQDLPATIRTEVESQVSLPVSANSVVTHVDLPRPLSELLPQDHQKFLEMHQPCYEKSMNHINELVTQGVIVSAPPIKKQTLAEKKYMIKNYSSLLTVFNQWISLYPDLGQPLDMNTLDTFADLERNRWHPNSTAIAVSDQPTID